MHREALSPVDPLDTIDAIDPLDPPRVVAAAINVSLQTLANWRSTGRHDLGHIKLGRAVRYPRSKWRAAVAAGLR